MESANAVVVGAGVVGLAVACELSSAYTDVFVLEALPRPGMLTSTRNSGVVHSGINYPPGSLKAHHCVEGNRLLYEFCERHHVTHRRTGKLVIATSEAEVPQLEALLAQGQANGVPDLMLGPEATVSSREPHIRAVAGLWAPSTGLVETESLLSTLSALATQNGVHIATGAGLESVEPSGGVLHVRAGEAGEIETRTLVNAAGLHADDVARLCGNSGYTIHPCRGEYWEIAPPRNEWVSGIVYPVPGPTEAGLGVHLTRTLSGTLLAGPNARYVTDKSNYESDWEAKEDFCQKVQRLLPEIQPGDLRRAYSGIRPKLTGGDDTEFSDFKIDRDPERPEIVHLAGIESPGLTAALSIACAVRRMVAEILD